MAEQEAHADHHIHMPSPSYWPLVVSVGLPIIALGLIYNHVISVVGASSSCSASTAGRRSRRVGRCRGRRPARRAARARSWRPLADVTLAPSDEAPRPRDRAAPRLRREEPPAATPPPACRTTSWRMWLFLGSECLLFGGLISTYMLYRGRTQNGPTSGDRLRHPVHLGQLVRAADELADDGAGGVGRPARRQPPHPAVAHHHGAARRHLRRRPGLRVHRLLPRGPRASRRTCSARASTPSPASTAPTSPSASSC